MTKATISNRRSAFLTSVSIVALATIGGGAGFVVSATPAAAQVTCFLNGGGNGAERATGNNSFACGPNANAENSEGNTAIGASATAGNPANSNAVYDNATAVGYSSKASAANSTAVGANTQATQAGAVSVGAGSSIPTGPIIILPPPNELFKQLDTPFVNAYGATGQNSTSVGYQSIASATSSTALGQGAEAMNTSAIAIGSGTTSGTSAQALGANSIAVGTNAIAYDLGTGNTTTAIGTGASAGNGFDFVNFSSPTGDPLAVGTNANAAGTNTTAAGGSSLALGTNASAYGSNANSYGNNSTAIGQGALAGSYLPNEGPSTPLGTNDSAFGSGAQAGYGAPGNFATVYDNATALGANSAADATNATAVGQGAIAANTGAIAIGSGGTVTPPISELFGTPNASQQLLAVPIIQNTPAQALGVNSIAIGIGSVANDVSGAGIGNDTTIAIGPGATAGIAGTTTEGGDILAIGTLATATGTNATAIGGQASATGDFSTAIGQGATATNAGDVALGQASVTDVAHPTSNATVNGVTFGNFAGTNPTSVVSVGGNGVVRQITNVAAGQISATSTDAVNGSQLYALAVAFENRTGGGTSPFVSNQQPGQAFPTATGPSASAGGYGANGAGAQSTAVGNTSNASGTNSTAIGYGAQAQGTGSIAVGQGAQAANGGTAVGTGAVATGDPTSSYGMDAQALGNNSSAYGANAVAGVAPGNGDNTTAVGQGANASLTNSVALGQGTTTTAASSTASNAALGIANNAGAVAAGSGNVVSVGGNGVTRQIQNVAAGAVTAGSTDAINGAQLYSVATDVNNLGVKAAAAIGGGAAYTPTGGLTGPSYTLNGSNTTYTNVVAGEQAIANGAAGPVQYSTPGTPSNAVNLVGTGGAVTLGNVAAGTVSATSAQAINGGQLYGNAASVASALGGGAGVTAAGAVSAPRYAIGGATYNNVGSALAALQGNTQTSLTNLQNQVSLNDQRLSGGIASAIAGSGLRYDDRAGKFSTAAAVAGYHDQFGFAGGFGYTAPDQHWRVNAAVTLAPVNGRTDVGGVGGLSYTWN